MRFSDKTETLKKINFLFFLAFIFFSAIFCGYTKVNNLLHISIILFILTLAIDPDSRKIFHINPERKKGFLYTLLFLVYFSVSNLWGDKPSNIESTLTHSVYLLLFLAMLVNTLDSKNRHTVLISCIVGLFLLCVYCLVFEYHSIIVFRKVSNHHPGPENVIDLAGYAAIGVILCLIVFREKRKKLVLFAIPVFLGVMVISQSRGPIIALILSLFITLPFRNINKKNIVYSIVTIVILSAALLYSSMGELIIKRFSELYVQSFLRLSIWSHTLQMVSEAPFFGHGFNDHLTFVNYSGEHIRTTHSVYLGTLLKGGVVGLALLILILQQGLKSLLNSVKEGQHFELSLYLFMMIFYLSQGIFVISNPTEYWYLFWFPLAFGLVGKRREQSDLSHR